MHCPENYGFNQIGNLTDQCAMRDNFFVEPFTELWKKLLGTAAYMLNLFGCLIMLAFVGFERQGFGSYPSSIYSWSIGHILEHKLYC